MITFIHGNIFETNAQVVTNTVNCVGVMGKGIALEFKRKFPSLFADYKDRCSRGEVRIGEPYLWGDESNLILNFPTKEHWRTHSKLEYIDAGLRYLADRYIELGIHSIAMPPLGCGNGGLEWSTVKELMVKHLGDLPDLEVYIYEPKAVTAARLDEGDGSDMHGNARTGFAKIAAERSAGS